MRNEQDICILIGWPQPEETWNFPTPVSDLENTSNFIWILVWPLWLFCLYVFDVYFSYWCKPILHMFAGLITTVANTLHITKHGSRKRSTSCCGNKRANEAVIRRNRDRLLRGKHLPFLIFIHVTFKVDLGMWGRVS